MFMNMLNTGKEFLRNKGIILSSRTESLKIADDKSHHLMESEPILISSFIFLSTQPNINLPFQSKVPTHFSIPWSVLSKYMSNKS